MSLFSQIWTGSYSEAFGGIVVDVHVDDHGYDYDYDYDYDDVCSRETRWDKSTAASIFLPPEIDSRDLSIKGSSIGTSLRFLRNTLARNGARGVISKRSTK